MIPTPFGDAGPLICYDIRFPEPARKYYHQGASLLLVPAGSKVKGIEDLGGKTVAVLEGSVQEKDLEQVAPGAKRVAFRNVDEAVAALRGKKVDALCQDDMLVLALAKAHGDLKVAGKPILPRPSAIAVRKGDAGTLRWVNEKLSAMKKDGTYDRLKEKHFGAAAGKEGTP